MRRREHPAPDVKEPDVSALSGTTRVPLQSRFRLGVAVLALSLGALTACGGASDTEPEATSGPTTTSPSSAEAPADGASPTSEAAPAEAQTVTATEGEMFIELSQEELTAGSITFEVVNSGSATHDFVVEQDGNDIAGTDSIAPGDSTTLTVDLAPGQYVVYCSVGDHRSLGMETTVTVT
jgi:uncharacterized cupredoxin-like copper-binding protein